ncbi:hypothetical protein [Halomonas salina]|uniref:Uncharacterized protein n=1 Tax=Halomonas salina TaxID=42565 RepID=A0ABR4WX48_9GAMM|nr:hypothetical protein [Halomonas salina]KGE79314.1 hypothetical protein FP66_11570 [Halomonas salina]
MTEPFSTTTSIPMDSSPPRSILYSPGPHDTRILLCECSNQEVIRGEAVWERFQPDFEQDTCRCLDCEATSPLSYHDNPRRHFRTP